MKLSKMKFDLYLLAIMAVITLLSCQNKSDFDSWINDPEKLMAADAKIIQQWLLDNNFNTEPFKVSNNDYHSSNNSILIKNKHIYSIAANGVSDIKELQGLSQLAELTFRKIKLINLYGCPHTIQKLSINGNIPSLEGIKDCKNIQSLELLHNQTKDLSPISNLTDLKMLNLGFYSYDPDSLSFSLPELTHLTIHDSHIEKMGLLGPFNNLEYLNLKNNNLSSEINVSAFPQLKYLDLSNNKITAINNISNSVEEINLLENTIKDISILSQWKSLKKIFYRPVQIPPPESLIGLIDGRFTNHEELVHEAQKLKNQYLNQIEFIEKLGTQSSGRATGVKNNTSTSAGLNSNIKISGSIQIDELEKFMQLKIVQFDDVLYYDKLAPISGNIKIESGQIKVYSPLKISFWKQALLYANQSLKTPNPDPNLEIDGYEIKEYIAGESVDFKAVLKPYAGIYMLLISAENGKAKNIEIKLN